MTLRTKLLSRYLPIFTLLLLLIFSTAFWIKQRTLYQQITKAIQFEVHFIEQLIHKNFAPSEILRCIETLPYVQNAQIVYAEPQENKLNRNQNTYYFPLVNKQVLVAEFSLNPYFDEIQKLLQFTCAIAALCILAFAIVIIWVSTSISQKLNRLTTEALVLASGNYQKKLTTKGPKEIQELASTIQTIGECLQEHVKTVEERSLMREKMIGEYEAFKIIQRRLINQKITDFSHKEIAIRAITLPSGSDSKFTYFDISQIDPSVLEASLFESHASGFEGISHLLQLKNVCTKKTIQMTKQSDAWQVHFTQDLFSPPSVVWNNEIQDFQFTRDMCILEKGGFLLILNSYLYKLMCSESSVPHWFQRVFRHFAQDGIETCMKMLEHELSFKLRRDHNIHSLIAICIHVLPDVNDV